MRVILDCDVKALFADGDSFSLVEAVRRHLANVIELWLDQAETNKLASTGDGRYGVVASTGSID